LDDYPVDPEKLALLPASLQDLAANPQNFQQAPDPLSTGLDFFKEWLARNLTPALPELEQAHLEAQYYASDPVAAHIVGNNNYRRGLTAPPSFFYFEHEGVFYPAFGLRVAFDEAFKQEPVQVFLVAVDSPQNTVDDLLANLANPNLKFDLLTLSNGPDTTYPQAVNLLITLGFKPDPADPYFLGLGSLNFTLLP
jgi:hypothetical protein